MDFGPLLGSPGHHFGGRLGARVSKWSVYVDIFCAFLGASKKGAKTLPKVIQKGVCLEAVDMAQV